MSTDIARGFRARTALWASFFLMGIVSMAWVPRIPEIKENIGINNGQFGFIFLGSTFGSLLAGQIAGRLIHKVGTKVILTFSSLVFPAGLILMGAARTPISLMVGLILMGFGIVTTDICDNAQAVAVEKIINKKCMTSFHGAWSLGSFVTTIFGGVMASHISPRTNLIGIGIVSLLLFIPTNLAMLPKNLDGHRGDGTVETKGSIPWFGKDVAVLWALAAGLLTSMIAEMSASDWSAILLHENMGIGPGLYASGFACFALAMITVRFLGDRIIEKFGAARTVRVGGYLGGLIWLICLAIAIPLSSHAKIPALIIMDIGFIFAGFAIGPMYPAFILAASRIPQFAAPVAIARVGLIGIAGVFVGPTVTGLIAEATSLSWAMLYPIGALFVAGFLSRAIKTEATPVTK
ncbi:MAG: MFS transporter [Candidatus Planktophila sp.]